MHAPPFLVQHGVVEHGANRQLWVLLDGIVLEVLVTSVAVQQVLPVWVALTDAAHECETHGPGLNVEGFVVLHDLDGLPPIEVLAPHLDRLVEDSHIELFEERARTLDIGSPAIDGECECLQALRGLTAL